MTRTKWSKKATPVMITGNPDLIIDRENNWNKCSKASFSLEAVLILLDISTTVREIKYLHFFIMCFKSRFDNLKYTWCLK